MSDTEKDQRLNWQQACAVLGCSRSRFYNLVSTGKIPATRFGAVKGVRVSEKDCLAWLVAHAGTPKT